MAGLTLTDSVRQSLTAYAQKYAVDPGVAMGVAQAESGGNQNAVSSKGAVGIMQLEPSTFYSLRNAEGQPFTDINDPQQNMEAGVVYLSQQYKAFGDWPTAEAAYNAGPGAVQNTAASPQLTKPRIMSAK
jgi:soluble lytic murein transglycosylase-like protein